MPAELTVTLDEKGLAKLRLLQGVSGVMAAKSLTFTAEKARDAWRAGEAVQFHLRRKWLQTGTQVRYATANNLNAQVGSMDKFFGRHVIGIDEKKEGRLFVPVQPIDEQGTHTQIRRQIARMMGTKTKPFWRNGILFRRLGPGHDAPLKVLAVMKDSVHIKPRFDALGITDVVVQKEFPPIYERLLIRWAETGKV